MKRTDPVKKKEDGVISISVRGGGFVKVPGYKNDIEISEADLHTALHGDIVEVLLRNKSSERLSGEITRIISRAKTGFAGVLAAKNGLYFLIPDDAKMYRDILIPEKMRAGGKPGDKAYAEIVSWTDEAMPPEGRIIKVLGRPGDNNAEMHAIALEKGFDNDLPARVEEEAKKIRSAGIKESDYAGRRDIRETLTFTIDPYDAKDFDDAISFKVIEGGLYEVGIHIADVTHYIGPGGAIDNEAKKRGTSVYLVDRTIPMLPEVLSNDLCSLLPNTDRLTMSAIFVLDKNARVKSEWFGRTVIHSKKRFTYEEAEKSIKNKGAPLHKELSILNGLAKKLTAERKRRGAISLDQEEVKFILDPEGVPIKVIKKERTDSHKLIEEFMLLANRKVAELLSGDKKKKGKAGVPARASLYRIHDLPSKEKMADLSFFLRSLGLKFKMKEGIIPSQELNRLLADLEKKGSRENLLSEAIYRAIVRSMAKAVYSTKNIGHYGLAFPYYTHFTSPIRRYPDMVVHRLLAEHLSGKKIRQEHLAQEWQEFEKIAIISSEQEKRAADAERASVKYKQVEYMSRHLGKTFEGIVSGMTEWGMYMEEIETRSEGLIRMRDMKDDFYIFNEKKLEMIGQKRKKRYRLGDKVKIKVKAVDLERKTIDYVLI